MSIVASHDGDMMQLPPALVLNKNYRPLSLLPLSVLSWEETVHNVVAGDLAVVAEYDLPIRSQHLTMKLPSVVATRDFVKQTQHVPMTNYNLFVLRDKMSCLYCGHVHGLGSLTRDHVVPRSHGGKTAWENVVTACSKCNHEKRDRTPSEAGMMLIRKAYRPTAEELARADFYRNARRVHESWRMYLHFID